METIWIIIIIISILILILLIIGFYIYYTGEVRCENDDDCQSPDICVENICIPACKSNIDCGDNKICDMGICGPIQCETNFDCGGGEKCIAGRCDSFLDDGSFFILYNQKFGMVSFCETIVNISTYNPLGATFFNVKRIIEDGMIYYNFFDGYDRIMAIGNDNYIFLIPQNELTSEYNTKFKIYISDDNTFIIVPKTNGIEIPISIDTKTKSYIECYNKRLIADINYIPGSEIFYYESLI